jgi:tocopherol cyclase
MFERLLKTWRPEIYQGWGKRRTYFEGWYYKIVDVGERNIWAVIPGVAYGQDASSAHAFIQLINGTTTETEYHRFPIEQFRYARNRLEIEIGGNRFTRNSIRLDIAGVMTGDLRFEGVVRWPVRLLAPGIMGWFAFVPFMETYHGIISLNHQIGGQLTIRGEPKDFSGGLGYIEKDWGRSFPSSWIWMQSNHFDTPETCLTASVARIPWMGRHFPGLIVGLWTGGKLYRFTTYTGARIERVNATDEAVELTIRDRRYRLEIRATRSGTGLLRSPIHGAMEGRDAESISALVTVSLFRKKGDAAPIFAGTGRNTGLEVVGDMSELTP